MSEPSPRPDIRAILNPLLPEGAFDKVIPWFGRSDLFFRLTYRQGRRLGAYVRYNDGRHGMILNARQNTYSLLITLVHEVAHLVVVERFGRAALPHGKEWKATFSDLLTRLMTLPSLPEDIRSVMRLIAHSPRSGHFQDTRISAILMRYERNDQGKILLCNLPTGSRFTLPDGKTYVKGDLKRTRYICRLAGTSKNFLIGGAVPVEQVA